MEKNIKMKRSFSTEFKKEKVALIEKGKLRIRDVVNTYQVSQTSVYKWLIKYGVNYSKTERVVVEKISEENKSIELLNLYSSLRTKFGLSAICNIINNYFSKLILRVNAFFKY